MKTYRILFIILSLFGSFLASAKVPVSRSCLTPARGQQNETVELLALSGLAVGVSQDLNQGPLLRPFTSDGCSMSPEGLPGSQRSQAWKDCCFEHDQAYWVGGSFEDKTHADEKFGQCIAQKVFQRIAKIYQTAVSRFGGPESKSTFRWGYGWTKQRPYSEHTLAEKNQIDLILSVPLFAQYFSGERETPSLCTIKDPSFSTITKNEAAIFDYLNKVLKNPTRIEWAYEEKQNLEITNYHIKIAACSDPLTFIIKKNHPVELNSTGSCLSPMVGFSN